MKRILMLCLIVGLVFPEARLAWGQSTKTLTNSIGMKFVLVPAGSFKMGSPPGDRDQDEVPPIGTEEFKKFIDKKVQEELEEAKKAGGFLPPPKPIKSEVNYPPQLQVTISKPFFLQTTEVTQEQWRKVMGGNPSHFKKCGKNCPVEMVSWYDAQKFIKELNRIEKTDKFRLPTEAEWEYACRARSTSRYTFGDDVAKLSQYAWYWKNSNGKTHPVGQLKPNAWGLFGMHGNVREWCQEGVLRGGSFMIGDLEASSAYRNRFSPGSYDPDFGFRVARDY